MRSWLALVIIGLATLPAPACLIGGGEAPLEAEQDPKILEFADRIVSFYDSIESIPLDVELTYGNSALRAYFASETDFAAYYASLAAQLRRAQFRNATLDQVSILEFRFDQTGVARVDLRLIGRHERKLRLGELRLPRQDTWQLRNGNWLVSPEKL
jgi:hypothetical protein